MGRPVQKVLNLLSGLKLDSPPPFDLLFDAPKGANPSSFSKARDERAKAKDVHSVPFIKCGQDPIEHLHHDL